MINLENWIGGNKMYEVMSRLDEAMRVVSGVGIGGILEQSMYPNGRPSHMDLRGIDIQEEYKLIKQKKSNLPKSKRDYIVRKVEG